MIRKKWLINSYDKNMAAQIAQDLSLNPIAALLATSRGLLTDTDISEFFSDSFNNLSDPYDLMDMEKAVIRLEAAIENEEAIVVFGDYDADGVTATALVLSYLEARGATVQAYIPDRITDGYGLSVDAVNIIKEKGAKLIITVDNGISAIEEAALISSLGMDLIITDHHKPKDILPAAVAVIDPHRTDCKSEFKDFAGVGVAFKLICALEGGDGYELLQEFGDLLAIGTVGDIVPLVGENRTIVKAGIKAINSYPRTGIRALLEAAGAKDKEINSSGIAFMLSPRINAAGRMGSANRALELLLTEDEELAENLAFEINDENIFRKKTEDEITEKVEEIFKNFPERKYDRIIVVEGDGWHNGVIGIVATRITEKYGRPCIIISRDGLTARGSGRSLEGFSLYDALHAVSGCLTHFGGHTLAAGFGIISDKIDDLRDALNKYAMSAEMPFPLQRIDFKLNPKSVDTAMVKSVEAFEPFGAGNPQPVFGLFGMKIVSILPVLDGKHTRIQVSKDDIKLNAIIFNCLTKNFQYKNDDLIDLAVQLDNNEFRNVLSVNIKVVNIRLSALKEEKVLAGLRLYESFLRGEILRPSEYKNIMPDRGVFAGLYRAISDNCGFIIDFEKLCIKIGDDGGRIAAIMIAVDVMLDLNLINEDGNGQLAINETNKKVILEESEILIKLGKCLA